MQIQVCLLFLAPSHVSQQKAVAMQTTERREGVSAHPRCLHPVTRVGLGRRVRAGLGSACVYIRECADLRRQL